MSQNESEPSSVKSISTQFIRGRNVLFALADFSDLYIDYYLHLKDNRIEIAAEHDTILKSALAAFALHCVSRPHNEVLAWTVNFQEPLLNLFLGGDNSDGSVVGRVFSEGVKKAESNVFYQDLKRGSRPLHRSVVDFEGSNVLFAVEEYYRRSEQRPARFFQLDGDRYAIITAHPDYDRDWFERLKIDEIEGLEHREELNVLETRPVRWNCGCDQRRVLKFLLPSWQTDPDELFLGEEMIEVNCPRCAGKYRVTRELMEAFNAEEPK